MDAATDEATDETAADLAANVDNKAAWVDVRSIKPGNPGGRPGNAGRPCVDVLDGLASFSLAAAVGGSPTPGEAVVKPVRLPRLAAASPAAKGNGNGAGKPAPKSGDGLVGPVPVLKGGNGLSRPFLVGVL